MTAFELIGFVVGILGLVYLFYAMLFAERL